MTEPTASQPHYACALGCGNPVTDDTPHITGPAGLVHLNCDGITRIDAGTIGDATIPVSELLPGGPVNDWSHGQASTIAGDPPNQPNPVDAYRSCGDPNCGSESCYLDAEKAYVAARDAHREPLIPTPLDNELVQGLTVWETDTFGAQMRTETEWARDDAGQLIYPTDATAEQIAADQVLPLSGADVAVVYIAMHDNCYRSTEDGNPYRIPASGARQLRDLLNIATARGLL